VDVKDPGEPKEEGVLSPPLKPLDRLERLRQALLEDVLRLDLALQAGAHPTVDHGGEARPVPLDEPLEGLAVAGLRPAGKLP
jgi:hypothetical protein